MAPKILIADKDAKALLATAGMVKSGGFEVLTAKSGRKCLELAKENQPYLILLDMNLSDLDPLEICQRIKADARLAGSLVVLVADKRISAKKQAQGLSRGADGYAVRPFEKKTFLTQLEAMLQLQKVRKSLKKGSDWQQSKLEGISEAVIVAKKSGEIVFFNAAAEKVTGWKREEALRLNYAKVFRVIDEKTGESAPEPVSRALTEGVIVSLVQSPMLIRKDGTKIPISASAAPCTKKHDRCVFVFQDISEKIKREHDLNRAIHDWESIFHAIGHPTIILEPDHRVSAVNNAALRATGMSTEEIIGKYCFEIFHENAAEPPEGCPLEKLLKSGRMEAVEMEMEALDAWFMVSCTPVFDSQGRLDKIIHIATDITDRKKTEQALNESEKKFRLLFSAANEGILILNMAGIIQDVNQKFLQMIGFSEKEILHKHLFHLARLVKIERPRLATEVRKFFQGESRRTEWSIRRQDGTKIFISLLPSFITAGDEKIGVSVVIEDITDRILTRKALEQSELSYRSIFNNASDAIYVQDEQGRFLDVNDGAEKMYGYPREYFIGKTPEFLSAPGKNDLAKIAGFVEKAFQGEPQQFEFWGLDKNGRVFPKIVRLNKGNYFGRDVVVAFAIDISARKQAEEKLRQASFQWRSTFDSMNDAIALLALDEKIIRCNKSLAKLAGRTFTDIIGKSVAETIFSIDQTAKDCPLKKAKKSKQRETKQITFGDRWYEIIVDPVKDDEGKLIGFVYILKDITEQRLIGQQLRENENKFRLLFEEANDAIFLMKDNVFVDCNRKTLEIFGCTREQIIGKTPSDFSPPEQADGRNSKEAALEKINLALKGKSPSFEWLHCRCDKTVFNAEVTLALIELKGKKHIQAIVRDVTERKAAEKALKESEEKYRHLIQGSNDAIYLLHDRKFEVINDKFTEMFGVALEDANSPDFDFMDLVAPESRPVVEERMKRFVAGEPLSPKYEFTAIAKNGEKIDLEASVSYIKYKEGVATQGILRDITERKRAVKALMESEEKYRKLVEDLPDAIVIHCEGKIVFANKASVDLIGASTIGELIGKPAIEFVHPDFRRDVVKRIAEAMQTGKAFPVMDEKFLRLDGSVIDVEVRGFPVTFENKPAIQVLIRDITDKKRAEEQIKKDLREKETLIKEIHHRVKNNLMVVTSLLGLQSRRISDKEAIEAFKDSINRVYSMAMVHQKLYQSKSLSEVDFKEFISTIARHVYFNYDISRRVKLEMDLEPIFLNIEKAVPLGLLLNELITNAMKYAFPDDRRGKIFIAFKEIKEGHCELTVMDDGVGLAPEIDFQTSDSLGMALIRQLADQIEGKIRLLDKKGTGFLVRFVL
ncbi:MAG: PAS domain S-box protein [Calditrichaeota bacterium]|nr:PAS domain S-box protein [Calditrichota bacterium]